MNVQAMTDEVIAGMKAEPEFAVLVAGQPDAERILRSVWRSYFEQVQARLSGSAE